MRKLLVLILVLGTAQTCWAGTALFRVAPDDVKEAYLPSDIITFEVVADFPVGVISMDYVHATDGEAMSTWLNAGFDDIMGAGRPINIGGTAVQGVWGTVALGSPDVEPGEVLWSFEYHIPDVPFDLVIEISTESFFAASTDFSDYATETNAVMISLIPEPMTLGLLGLGGLFLRRRK